MSVENEWKYMSYKSYAPILIFFFSIPQGLGGFGLYAQMIKKSKKICI